MLRTQGFVTALALAVVTMAGMQAPASAAPRFAGAKPVSDAQLAHLRGGFSIGSGPDRIQVSLGIDRLSFVNGELATITRLGGSGGDSGIRLVQNGSGNRFDRSVLDALPAGTLGTVIQNSLDDQTIRNLNVFNITVTSRKLAQSLSVRSAVQDALTRGVR